MRVEQKNIDGLQLLNVAVSLELLSHLCADGGHGHVERVHLLDLGCLDSIRSNSLLFSAVGYSYGADPFTVGLNDSLLGIAPVDGCEERGQ